MSVQTSVVKETIVGRMVELVREAAAGAPLSRAGYELRNVERRLFEPARRPTPGLAEELHERIANGASEGDAIDALSRELADAEPLGRPEPGARGAWSWRVPGPGGHVRHYVAMELVGDAREAKREVLYGFFRRCCEEALEGVSAGDASRPTART
jgi:hypothetical protein